MTTSQAEPPPMGIQPGRFPWSRASSALWRRPWARATALLTPPLAWFLLIYIASLAVLLITAFWTTNAYTGNLERLWNLGNFRQIIETAAYRSIIGRTVLIAAAVTVTDAVLAFPFAYYMARIARPRIRTVLFVAILLPLWASYLAKIRWPAQLEPGQSRHRRAQRELQQLGGLHRLLLHLAAVHGDPDIRRA